MVSHRTREIMKRRPAKRKRRATQPSLFHATTAGPSWRAVSEETRREVRRLLAQMLLAYREQQDTAGDEEVPGE